MWDIKDCRYDTLCPEGQICGRTQTKRVCDEKTVKEILPLFEAWLRQFSEAPGPRSLGKELAQTLPLEDLLPLYFQHQGSQPLSAKQTCNYLRELAHAISFPLCHPGENEICIPSIRCQACENIPGSSLKEFFDLYSEPFRKLDSVKSLWQLRLGTTMPPTASAVYDILMGKSNPSCSSLAALQRFALTPDDKKKRFDSCLYIKLSTEFMLLRFCFGLSSCLSWVSKLMVPTRTKTISRKIEPA